MRFITIMIIDKKDQIIKIAIELFAEKGYEGTSIRDIASKAEVNVAMISYYFGSKEKLFESMIEKYAAYIREQLEEITNDNNRSEWQKMDAIIEHYVNRLLSNHKYHRVIHQELLIEQRENIHEIIIKGFSKNRDLIKEVLKSGIEKKEFRQVDPELTIVTIVGTINQAMLSKSMCSIYMAEGSGIDPYTDEVFRNRIITHIKQLIHSHLHIQA